MNDGLILDVWARRVYLTWLARDIRHALSSLQEIRARAGRQPDPLIWIPIETFLMFTAKVSKMLKPPLGSRRPPDPVKQAAYDRRKLRGEQLRDLLHVAEDSPVLDRKVRDASEHFDERLDDWIAQQPRPTADDLEAGVVRSAPSPPLRTAPDHDTWIIEVAGNSIDLTAVEAELQRLLDQITQLEPLTLAADAHVATLFASLAPFPAELTLNAPTRRPAEDVLSGVDPAAITAIDSQVRDAIARLAAAFSTPSESGSDPT